MANSVGKRIDSITISKKPNLGQDYLEAYKDKNGESITPGDFFFALPGDIPTFLDTYIKQHLQ